MKPLARLRSLWRGIRRRDQIEDDMQVEFRQHIALRAQDLERRGLTPAQAHRQARLEFGSVEDHTHQARGSRGLWKIDGVRWSWIDIKLGARMLVKYPGLTIVGGLGLAVGIAIAATGFGIIDSLLNARLPLDEGDRIVAINNVDSRGGTHDRLHLHDLPIWKTAAPAIADFGAYRVVQRNLIAPGRGVDVVRVTEITGSGFQIARVSPMMGRYIVPADEAPSADPVVVLGHALWQTRFAGDPGIIGKSMQLGSETHEIVGVMPESFAFPINDSLWTALRLRDTDVPRGEAPRLGVFGRLSADATLSIAQAQFRAVGERLRAASPATHRDVEPLVEPYAAPFLEGADGMFTMKVARIGLTLLLVVIGTNVAVLVYARTAARAAEITLRTALGASRLRIITQFFAEALVLTGVAAAIGLLAARFAVAQLDLVRLRVAGDQFPYWMAFRLTPATIVYVASLAVLAALIVGAIPALKATGRGVLDSLRRIGGGGAGLRLGKGWTTMIVLQVAVTVALLPIVVGGSVAWINWSFAQGDLPTGDFLTMRLVSDSTDTSRLVTRQREIMSRLAQEPNVAGIVRMTAVPGEEPRFAIELDARGGPQGTTGVHALASRVGVEHFAAFEVPVIAGRTFEQRDLTPASSAVIVNEGFSKRLLGDANPLGRRFRVVSPDAPVDASTPWLEIVGVVSNFPAAMDARYVAPRFYQPLPGDDPRGMTIAVRARDGAPAELLARVREIAAGVDPALRLAQLEPLDTSLANQQAILQAMLLAAAVISGSTLLLSSAGIYALISLTVTRRHREIALRVALGAAPRRVIGGILGRALAQIAAGIVLGILAAIPLSVLDGRGIVVVAVVMSLVGIGAAIGPARRCLRIQPTEALKAE